MKLVFSRIANGDRIFTVYSIPHLEVSDELQDQIHDLYEYLSPLYKQKKAGLQYVSKEYGPYLAYLFEVPSTYFPDVPVYLMLTLYFEDHENINFFKDIVEEMIIGLSSIRDLSKSFYLGTPHAEKDAYKVFAKMMKVLTDGFFELSKKHETYNLGLAEILVLGDKGGGKTTIVDYLTQGKFVQQQEPTLTPKVLKLYFENTDFRVLDTCCKAHIEEILGDHPLDIKKLPQAVVYVVDVSSNGEKILKNVEEFQYWMEYLDQKYPKGSFSEIPLLIIFNKTDLNPDFDEKEMQELFNPIKVGITPKYLSTSALKGDGLSDNFKWMLQNITVSGTLV